MALKMRFGTQVSDLQDTLCAFPDFLRNMKPEEYDPEVIAMFDAFRLAGRKIPRFSDDFDIFVFAHRSKEIAVFLLTVLDTILAYDEQQTIITLTFEYGYNVRTRSYDFMAHVEVLAPTKTVAVPQPDGNFKVHKVSTRSGPRSIVAKATEPPPTPEPPRRRMTFRRTAELKSIAKSL